jgi:quercetin dioxygenase-like cupin family protein
MLIEVVTRRDHLLIRRLVLAPGEVLPWHTDACESFAVVVRGDRLTIEFRDNGERAAVAVHAGMAGWNAPEPRAHRAINTGATEYEEVATFYLQSPDMDPQPAA